MDIIEKKTKVALGYAWALVITSLFIQGCGGSANGAGDQKHNQETSSEAIEKASKEPDEQTKKEARESPPVEKEISAQDFIVDHNCTRLSSIPQSAVDAAKASLHIAYQHTSHGSQLVTGMNTLAAYPAFQDRFAWKSGGSPQALDLKDMAIRGCADLSKGDSVDDNGDTPWVVSTRAFLDKPANKNINVVLWSWCGIDGHDAQRYVDNMEKLISEYPNVTFPFMTGHAFAQGEDMKKSSIHYNNELIRRHCKEKGRFLFDFADIEAYDPSGNYFLDRAMYDNLNYDSGNWAAQWISANPNTELASLAAATTDCAHSYKPKEANLNCVLKGIAAWWMWARIAGWNP